MRFVNISGKPLSFYIGGTKHELAADGVKTFAGSIYQNPDVVACAETLGTSKVLLTEDHFIDGLGAAPDALALKADDGETATFVFADAAGLLKVHNAAPAADEDGDVVGAQTVPG